MSVLIEALCLVIRNRVLDVSYPGGATAFVDDMSMREDVRYAITDGTLSAVSMFEPSIGAVIAEGLEARGVVGADEYQVVEFAFVDMHTGSTMPCDWLETLHHPHGFMVAWETGREPGQTAVPADWDPSRSWGLERTDIRDDPEHGLVLGSENGFTTLLDLKSGHVTRAVDAISPIVKVGGDQVDGSEGWNLLSDLPESMQAVQQMLRLTGIPFHFDKSVGAIRIPFHCDVVIKNGAEEPLSKEIRQRMLVTVGPGTHDITCSVLLPVCIPVHLRSEFAKIAKFTNILCDRLRVDFENDTGTVAITTFTFAGERPLDDKSAERAVANASPVGGDCYAELVEWLEGRTGNASIVFDLFAQDPHD